MTPLKSGPRWALSAAVFIATFVVGLLATGWVVYRIEPLLNLLLSGVGIFRKFGLFSSLDGEGWEDAVFESLTCLWLPLATLLTWYVNRWLKRPG